jgi:hypothetical protein
MRCVKRNAVFAVRMMPAALLALAVGHATAQSSDAMSPFGWLRDLAGACWAGKQADGKPIDTQCYEVQFGRFLRGTIEIHGDTRSKLRGDSVWAWDAAKQRITLISWANIGPINSSEAYFEGELVRFPVARREGATTPEMRRTWRRIDADSFVVSVERYDGGDWRETQKVLYRRAR